MALYSPIDSCVYLEESRFLKQLCKVDKHIAVEVILSGSNIYITRLCFDELEFLGIGSKPLNSVDDAAFKALEYLQIVHLSYFNKNPKSSLKLFNTCSLLPNVFCSGNGQTHDYNNYVVNWMREDTFETALKTIDKELQSFLPNKFANSLFLYKEFMTYDLGRYSDILDSCLMAIDDSVDINMEQLRERVAKDILDHELSLQCNASHTENEIVLLHKIIDTIKLLIPRSDLSSNVLQSNDPLKEETSSTRRLSVLSNSEAEDISGREIKKCARSSRKNRKRPIKTSRKLNRMLNVIEEQLQSQERCRFTRCLRVLDRNININVESLHMGFYRVSIFVNSQPFWCIRSNLEEATEGVCERAFKYLLSLKLQGVNFSDKRFSHIKNALHFEDDYVSTDVGIYDSNLQRDQQSNFDVDGLRTDVSNNVKNINVSSCLALPVGHDVETRTGISDAIAKLVLEKFDELKENYQQYVSKCYVLSGIVMVRDSDYQNGTVISIGMGNKCVRGKYISRNGDVIHDSHAEILARRGLIYHLYNELGNFYRSQGRDSIFQYNNDDASKMELLSLKSDISFHLYISSAPCGDARIYMIDEEDSVTDKHKNRSSRGRLRCILEVGQGTIPTCKYDGYNQTWEDIKSGQRRLLTMSCSDKLLKMNVLGIQGSLLTNYIEPVYLGGIFIGKYFNVMHSTRALYERLEGRLGVLQEPFYLHKPKVEGTTSSILTALTPKSKHCLNWIIDQQVEVINSKTGKTTSNTPSRLCKRNLVSKFMEVLGKSDRNFTLPRLYSELKNNAEVYNRIKLNFYKVLEENYMGKWIRRNYGPDDFCII